MEVAPMKRLLVLAAIFVAGCTQQQSDQLSPQQIDQIKNEVKAVGDSIIAKAEKGDPGWQDYYSDVPEWVMLNADGSRWDYQTFKKVLLDSSYVSYKWTTTRQDFMVITKDLVLCVWAAKDETLMKSGEKVTYDPHAYTMLFKKIAGQWKVFYSHDSGTPVMQKAGKK
jgi:hypothetical protein